MSHYISALSVPFKEWRVWALLALPTFMALIYWSLQYTSIGYLQLHSIDEYTFHGSLRYMLESLSNGKLSGLFGYGFYQYGFIYFAINLLVTAPFIITNHTELAIAIPRVITSLFAIGSLVVFYQTARQFSDRTLSLLAAAVIVTMPAFWYSATWFHPDWPMTFWLLACVYFLTKDQFTYKENFWIGVVCYGAALAFKYQAITALPLLLIYFYYEEVRRLDIVSTLRRLPTLLCALTLAVGVFLAGNPYIIHPLGWNAFASSFVGAMDSNATNHGLAEEVTISDKINGAISDSYMNVIFFFILSLSALWLCLEYFRKSRPTAASVVAINFLANIIYLLLFVNKTWQIYYLPTIMVGLVLLLHYLPSLNRTWQVRTLLLVLIVQIVSFGSHYSITLTQSRDNGVPDHITYSTPQLDAVNSFIIDSLRPEVTPTTTILLTPYTPFEYEQIGLSFERVRIIYGALGEASFTLDAYLEGQRMYWKDLKTDEELARSFKPIDFIVLRKDIPYIATERIEPIRNQAPYWEASVVVKGLYSGKYNYELFVESDEVVIFKSTI